MIEPAQLGVNFGRTRSRRERYLRTVPAPGRLLVLHGPTLLDSAGELVLWALFTGRTTEEATMHANDLLDLGEAMERRSRRAIASALEVSPAPLPGPLGDLCRKRIADELTSEWLRMHNGRRLKRGETQLLTRMHLQLQDAVQLALAGVPPHAMPATAREAIRACATQVGRRR